MRRLLLTLFFLSFFYLGFAEEFYEKQGCFDELAFDLQEDELLLDLPELSKKLTPPKKHEGPKPSLAAMQTLQAEPSSIFMGSVNMITGSYVESATDMMVQGAQPIVIQRFYTSNEDIFEHTRNSLFQGWHLNHASKTSVHDHVQNGTSMVIVDEGGSQTLLDGEYKNGNYSYKLHKNMLKEGLTNTGGGTISGRTNVKNTRVKLFKDHVDVTFGSGAQKAYFQVHDNLNFEEYQLVSERTPNKNSFIYNYTTINDQPYISRIDALNNFNCSLAHTFFEYDMLSKDPKMVIYSHDSQNVQYHFYKLKNQSKRFLLSKMKRSDGYWESFTYGFEGLLTQKDMPNDQYRKIQYYTEKRPTISPRVFKRVMNLASPSGADLSPLITHTFLYHFEESDGQLKRGISGAYDCYGNHLDYVYDSSHRLISINRCPKDKGGIFSQENFFWGPKKSVLEGQLISKTMQDVYGNIYFCKNFIYDLNGNVQEEKLFGNLTGNNVVPIHLIDGNPQENGCEVYKKSYTYSSDGYNLMLSEQDCRSQTVYSYYPLSDLLKSKFVKVLGKIVHREFYFYDGNSALIFKIADDGCTEDENNYTGVSQRIHTYIQNRAVMPIGLPEVIEERFVNPINGHEGMLSKVVNTYTSQGKLIREDHYNHYGILSFSNGWDYNEQGNVINEYIASSQVIRREYDVNNNCTKKIVDGQNFETTYTYDHMNRLVIEADVYPTITLSRHYRYDPLGNRISSTDIYGNETQYSYDDKGNLIETRHPLTLDENLNWVIPTERTIYDILGNPVIKIDPKGGAVQTAYTIRGQPYKITYPDGTFEKYAYTIDGYLERFTAKNGTTTAYTLDYQGRPVRTEVYAPSGALLSVTTATYNHFHLLSETDGAGNLTTYSYHLWGDLAEIRKGNKRTVFTYDPLFRLSKTSEYIDQDHCLVKAFEYDLLNRVIEERTEDEAGRLISKVNYAYDVFGNRSEITTYNQAGVNTTKMVYNAYQRVELTIDAEGNCTRNGFHYLFRNVHGQTVACEDFYDQLGNLTRTVFDTHGREATITRHTPFGQLSQYQERYYDLNGNLARVIDAVISPKEPNHNITTLYKYDNCNRLIRLMEAVTTPDERHTAFVYNEYGQKAQQHKPNGTILFFNYNALGLLADFFGSDQSFHYHYSYDGNNNVIQVDNHFGTATYKAYDANDRLIKEVLSNGLSLGYSYDGLDRLLTIDYPDSSKCNYTYDTAFLRQVEYQKGGKSYLHQYNGFDLSGLPSQVVNTAGDAVSYQYDILGRLRKCSSRLREEENLLFDKAGHLLQRKITDPQGSVQCNYAYDHLNQLIKEDGVQSHSYLYDSVYNRLEKDSQTYQVNDLNQLKTDGLFNFTYDRNGNLTSKGEFKYFYDAMDRLIAVELGNKRWQYQYDELNRRLSKSSLVKTNGTWEVASKELFFYENLNEIGSYQNGLCRELRVLGLGKGGEIGSSVLFFLYSKAYCPLHDYNGHVVGLVDCETKNFIESYCYSVFGEEQAFDASNNFIAEPLNPWRFSSKRTDSETGFVYFGMRYYDSVVGRWVTCDPMGFEEGPNLYAYVSNSPLIFLDKYGLQKEIDYKSEENNESQNNSYPTKIEIFNSYVSIWGSENKAGWYHLNRRELPRGVRCVTNGMCTSLKNFIDYTYEVSDASGGYNVYFFYNPTRGLPHDGKRSFFELYFYKKYQTVKHLSSFIMNFYKNKPDEHIDLIAHSEGGINARNNLRYIYKYNKACVKNVDLLAIAPAAYTEKKYCNSVTHLATKCDIVTYFDIIGRIKCRDTIKILKSHKDAPLWDHDFMSPTYKRELKTHIDQFNEKYGGI